MDEEDQAKIATNIFLDKRVLAAMVIDKEGQLNGAVAAYLKKLHEGYIDVDKPNISILFQDCWKLCYEIYSFLKYNDIREKEKKHKAEFVLLTGVMAKYESLDEVTHVDLIQAYQMLTKFITLSGYHHVKTQDDKEFDPFDTF